MSDIEFGCIGVDVEGYSQQGLRRLFEENGLDSFIANHSFLGEDGPYKEGRYLQAECRGLLRETTSLYVLSGYISHTTDIETFLLILRTALLDITAANALINEMYYQGLITPKRVI
jgi:hypothetical protein